MFATSNYQKMDRCRKIDGNKIINISELFRCFFDVFFLCFVFLYNVFSIFLLFDVLSFYVSLQIRVGGCWGRFGSVLIKQIGRINR